MQRAFNSAMLCIIAQCELTQINSERNHEGVYVVGVAFIVFLVAAFMSTIRQLQAKTAETIKETEAIKRVRHQI